MRLGAVVVASIVVATGAATPAPARDTRATLTPMQATNELLAAPWAKFAKQLERDAERSLEELEGTTVAGGGGSVGITYEGVGVTAAWKFGVKAHEVSARVDLSRPPGLTAASPEGIALAAPKDGGWSLGFQAILEPYAWVKVAGVKIWQKRAHVPFAIGIKDFRVVARAELDSSEADRPRLVRATIEPTLKLGGAGAFPGIVPVTFATTVEQGKVTMRASAIVVPLAEFGFANARFYGDLTVVMRPSSLVHELDLDVVRTSTEMMHVSVRLKGKLAAEIKYVPNAKESFDFDVLSFQGHVPSFDQLNDLLRLTKQPTPRSWGENQPRGWVPPPGADVDYGGTARALEAGIERHLPHGAVLSIDCAARSRDPRDRGCTEYEWEGDEDSAIWTGHYLAAEAFRYGTGETTALARVEQAMTGIERLFWVTGDAAIAGDRRVAVSDRTGILARTVMPIPQRRGDASTPYGGDQLGERKCYYERPEGGWSAAGRTYAALRLVPKEARDAARPVGRVWRGWGCGDDHPVSKDQYTGVLYGLAVAHQLVPVPAIQARIRTLVRHALDYLVGHGWNVRLPPDDRYETTFLGDFSKQLAFLRIGATVLGGAYEDRYLELSPANSSTWMPIWFSAADPVFQYYKFNLSHATLSAALLLETDPRRRAGFEQAHAMMWRAVRHHRNAYFGLLRVLAQPPGARAAFAETKTPWLDPQLTVGDEIRSVLGEWIARYELVKSDTGMPTGAVGDPVFQSRLAPTEVASYVGFDGSSRRLATFALPLTARNGRDKDFMWQRDPFDTSYRGSIESCRGTPPSKDEVARCGGRPNRTHPGVDYLLAYWLAAYVGIVPAPDTAAPAPPPAPVPPPAPSATPEPPTPIPHLLAGAPKAVPVAPRAASRLTIRMVVTRTDTRTRLRAGTVACAARVGHVHARVLSRGLRRGLATCAFRIPPRTRGKLVRGTISVASVGKTVRRSFRYRVR